MNDNAVQDFVKALKEDTQEPSKTYGAYVSHVDDEGVVWVRIAGAETETPTASKSAEVKPNDYVNVEWRNNKLYIAGNTTNPSAGVARVLNVEAAAATAQDAANSAVADAGRAREAADEARATANSVHDIAVQAQTDAGIAKASATNASEYAARALGNLSTVQSVTETLNWITAHGTMTLTEDYKASLDTEVVEAKKYYTRNGSGTSADPYVFTLVANPTGNPSANGYYEGELDPTHVYFVRDVDGDYEVGDYTYSVVTEPDVQYISTYYVLSIDESLNNYVGTHLAVTSEGLWLIPEANGNKVLVSTGGVGHTYEDAGTYIIDENDNISAQFLEDGATIYGGASGTLIAHLGYGAGTDSGGGTSNAPYYTLGVRATGSSIGNWSVAEGVSTKASGYNSHAEGYGTTASGNYSHAEGQFTYATGTDSHTEGYHTTASGTNSHAEGYGTTASGYNSHAEGDDATASAQRSHAEGYHTTASGYNSHAEGVSTTASGKNSHAEGDSTTASGDCSHSGGYYTIAQRKSQTAIGEFNIADTSGADSTELGDYAFIIGNGTSGVTRSNALTVDWGGRVEAGDYSGTLKSIFDIFYPVGSYYETSDANFNPNTAWGGTWYKEIEGQVHISSGSTYSVSGADTTSTVGSETRVGTNRGGNKDAIVPYHNHGFTNPEYQATGGSVGGNPSAFNTNSSGGITNGITGGGKDDGITGGAHTHSINGRASYGGGGTYIALYKAGGTTYLDAAASKSHTHDLPSHTHTLPNHTHSTPASSHTHNFTQPTVSLKSGKGGSVHYEPSGGSGNATNANLQPYIVVHRWHRIA